MKKKRFVFRLNDKIFSIKAVGVTTDAEILFEDAIDATIPPNVQDLIDAQNQADLDTENATKYKRDRKKSHKLVGDQLDMIYWDMKNGTNAFVEYVDAIKAAHPKPV